MSEIISRIVSSLEKPIPSRKLESYPELKEISVLCGEQLNFQLLISAQRSYRSKFVTVSAEGTEGEFLFRAEMPVVCDMPTYPIDTSVGTARFIESEGNIYPDILEPLDEGKNIMLRDGTPFCLWIEYTPKVSGKFDIKIKLSECGNVLTENTLSLTVADTALPEQSTIFTEWFHCDCLASYYRVDAFSEEHFRIIENFLRCAAKNGINCILTPIFSLSLDTSVGSYRPTAQLVSVRRSNGKYSFDFSLLKRWITLCRDCGIKYFEISHLFSQWGAEYAPKVVADTEDGVKRIFGWDTPGTEGEYPIFLAAFLPELIGFLKKENVLENCRFHISDEPNGNQLERYLKAKSIVTPYLAGCTVIDALSDPEFVKRGIIETPVPSISRIGDFLSFDIDERWAYYCCVQWDKVSNRFIAYPSFRNRIIGIQLYKFGISGFLQWGYNFYYSMGSRRLINPFVCQSGEGQVPGGDPFSVYPAADGTPLETPRIAVFAEALRDIEALKLCEKIIGRDAVIDLIDSLAGMNVTFTDYPDSADYILKLREKVNGIIISSEV